MGLDSIWHWLILLIIVLAVFGAGKLTKIGPDLGNAVREFKKAMHGGDDSAGSDEAKRKAAAEETLRADPPPTADTASTTQGQHDSHESK